MHPTQTPIDLLIVGAGIVGSTLAYALAERGFRVGILEQRSFHQTRLSARDFRGIAITAQSQKILDNFGLWQRLKDHTSPIFHIRVTDQQSPLFLDFNTEPDVTGAMGYMIINHNLKEAFEDAITSHPNIQPIQGHSIEQLEQYDSHVTVTLTSGDILTVPLVIAADGKESPLRTKLGIKVRRWDYKRSALVTIIEHELSHQFSAQERFYRNGPFAALPLAGEHRSAIVWVEPTDTAKFLQQLPEETFLTLLQQKFGDGFGTISLASSVSSYPLSALHATEYHKGRVVLVGDAAHTIHPIAGQGLNLGFHDVEALVTILTEQSALGLDIGDGLIMDAYSHARQGDNFMMFTITHALDKIFASASPLTTCIRRLGLRSIHHLPRLKSFLMRYAMGERL